jgi:uncharacterized protein with GYD domain
MRPSAATARNSPFSGGSAMEKYVMLGKYSLEGVKGVSAARSDQAQNLIRQNGGELKDIYALMGDVDLVLIVEFPDRASALKTSVGLSKLLGVSFSTAAAFTVDELDQAAR